MGPGLEAEKAGLEAEKAGLEVEKVELEVEEAELELEVETQEGVELEWELLMSTHLRPLVSLRLGEEELLVGGARGEGRTEDVAVVWV